MFTRDDARWLSDAARVLYAARSVDGLAGAAMEVLDWKFRLHSFACEELGYRASTYRAHRLRCATPPPPDHTAHFHDFPMLWVVGARQPPPVIHLRGDVASSVWEKTDHFNGLARPMGWNDHIVLVAQSHPTFVEVGLHRDVNFTAREHKMVSLLQPHLAAAWARVQPESVESAQSLSPYIYLSPKLHPIHVSDAQTRLISRYFPHWRERSRLPTELQTWIAGCAAGLREHPPPQPLRAFAAESSAGRLLIRYFPGPNAMGELRIQEIPANPNFLRLRAGGLTTRECEVLHWIAQGKRNSEIAQIIGVATSTINKHVENVLSKLSSKTRGAAVSAARRWIETGA